MTLIKTLSGIRGTIGGHPDECLNPLDIVKYATAFALFLGARKMVVGRDSRQSGPMVRDIVVGTLVAMGCQVVDIGLASTPTTAFAVRAAHADGGIIITASHNAQNWNALKLLNSQGELLSAPHCSQVLSMAHEGRFTYADAQQLGQVTHDQQFHQQHIDAVLRLPLVNVEAIRQRRFRVCVDAVNSVGATLLPPFLQALGIDYEILNTQCDGHFPHPLDFNERNLQGITERMKKGQFDLGIVVDSDVDSLTIVCEDGSMFGQEYVLVAVADYVLSHTPGNVVSHLSNTRALRDVTQQRGGHYFASVVGEPNLTQKMKEVNAIIGGDGNGGIIYPPSHYGRDALVGIALFLSALAQQSCTVSQLRATFPAYRIIKNHIDLTADIDVDTIFHEVKKRFVHDVSASITDIDGLKIDYPDRWVHLRKSNTEPVIRVYSEAQTIEHADDLGNQLMRYFYDLRRSVSR